MVRFARAEPLRNAVLAAGREWAAAGPIARPVDTWAMEEAGASAWRPIVDAFESRNDDRIIACCDAEIEWHTLWPGMEGVFRGWAGIKRWRAAIDEALAGLSLHMDEAIELGPDLFYLAYRLSAHGRQSGVASNMALYDLWKLRDGKLLRRLTFHHREDALAAARELVGRCPTSASR